MGSREIIGIVVTGFVELFTSAATNGLLRNVEGSKIGKIGAKIGGFLVGMYIGDKVTDYICDSVEKIGTEVGNVKNVVEMEKES